MAGPILSNTFTKAVTVNHADDGRAYYYRVVDGQLLYRVGAGEWFPLLTVNTWPPGIPHSTTDEINTCASCAADNNRIFILTEDGQLYWQSLKPDSASWVVLLFTIAEYIGSADPAVSSVVLAAIEQVPGLRELLDPDGDGLDSKTLIWDQFDDSMKTIEGVEYTDLEQWAADYRTWVKHTHQPEQGWNSLHGRWWDLGMSYGSVETGYGRFATHEEFLEAYDILDIAVGNWKDTVVTYYVLAKPKSNVTPDASPRIFFLDEEALVQTWREVPEQDGIQLDAESMICASHSVIAAVSKVQAAKDRYRMQWVRFDAHTCDNIKVWPINWTELWRKIQLPFGGEDHLGEYIDISRPHDMGVLSPLVSEMPPADVFDLLNYPGWHSIDISARHIEEFRIDVAYASGPWPVPQPYHSSFTGVRGFLSPPWMVYFLVSALSTLMDQFRDGHSEVGFLGDNSVKPNGHYPMCCVIRADGIYKGFSLQSSMGELLVDWVDIDPEQSRPSWLCRVVVLAGSNVNQVRIWVCETIRVRTCEGNIVLRRFCIIWRWVSETICHWLTGIEGGISRLSKALKCIGCAKGLGDDDYPGK